MKFVKGNIVGICIILSILITITGIYILGSIKPEIDTNYKTSNNSYIQNQETQPSTYDKLNSKYEYLRNDILLNHYDFVRYISKIEKLGFKRVATDHESGELNWTYNFEKYEDGYKVWVAITYVKDFSYEIDIGVSQ